MGSPAEEFGPYTVYEQIGLGGMATVHRAEAQGIAGFSKQVALKRMLPSVASDASLVKSFIREARLASHLRHANVAQTYDLGKVGEIYFIAMELVPGRNLRELLKHCASVVGHMPMPIAMNIVNQICDALDYAHNLCDDSGQPLGIIHRDVSPSNIIVSEGGVVKLIDFGIAKASGRGMNTQSGTIKGKFGYMAPEYLMGSIDARADLFALGVIAHELLSNRPLFQGKDDMDTLTKVREMPIMPPSHFNHQVPRELDAIIMTALDRDPEQRWQRATALHTALSTETKRLGLVAPNSQVFDWVEWAFNQRKGQSQFDEASEPMISISGGTTELPRGTPAHRREVPDDFQQAGDSLKTLIKPSPARARADDWNVATDMTTPMSDSMDRQWGNASTAEPTKLLRPSGHLRTQPPADLIDTKRDHDPPAALDDDQIRTLSAPGRVTGPQRTDQARTVMMAPAPSEPPAHQARTVMLDVNNPPAYRAPERPSQPPPLGLRRPSQPPPQIMQTLPGQGGMVTPLPNAAPPPMSPVLSGTRTSPHIPRQRDTPVRLDDLAARGERPAARQLVTPTVAKTRVEPRRGTAGNFLLAVLVLIAAGGAAAVVYFALPYLT